MNSQAILFHEYTHHWMLTNDAWADAAFPPWFVEGFAELHATAIVRNGDVIFGAIPTYRGYTVGNMNLLPASQLLLPNPGHLRGEQLDALYSRGWLLMDYMTFNADRLRQLAEYVTAINSGKSPKEASGAARQSQRPRFQAERLWEAGRPAVRADPGQGPRDREGHRHAAVRARGRDHARLHPVETRCIVEGRTRRRRPRAADGCLLSRRLVRAERSGRSGIRRLFDRR